MKPCLNSKCLNTFVVANTGEPKKNKKEQLNKK